MTDHAMHRERLMDLVAAAQNHRMQPGKLGQRLAQEAGFSAQTARELIKKMIEDGDLVYSYRDPCSYVEIPCNGCEGGHQAARPMKVVKDDRGDRSHKDQTREPSRTLHDGILRLRISGQEYQDCGNS